MDSVARILAFRIVLVFVGGILIGSLSVESGNVFAFYLKIPYEGGHFFNPYFLAFGIVGIMLSCVLGHKKCK